jgi:hypothetical protein
MAKLSADLAEARAQGDVCAERRIRREHLRLHGSGLPYDVRPALEGREVRLLEKMRKSDAPAPKKCSFALECSRLADDCARVSA